MTCPVSHGHWKVKLEINIKSQTGPLSLIPKCPLWHPFISLWAGSMESTDLRNKAHILICLWASSSSSLSLSFVFCTRSCWLLRVFPESQEPQAPLPSFLLSGGAVGTLTGRAAFLAGVPILGLSQPLEDILSIPWKTPAAPSSPTGKPWSWGKCKQS